MDFDWFSDAAERECPTCGAKVGQQCSDENGCEWGTKIHPARDHAHKMWVIRFRYISPHDYNTPLGYLPEEETLREAASAEDAWNGFVASCGDTGQYLHKLEVYEHPWIKSNG